MKKLLELLDNYATAKLETFADYIIVRFKLDEKDDVYHLEQPKLRTVHPKNKPSQDEWFKQFRVSCLHGKVITYISEA